MSYKKIIQMFIKPFHYIIKEENIRDINIRDRKNKRKKSKLTKIHSNFHLLFFNTFTGRNRQLFSLLPSFRVVY